MADKLTKEQRSKNMQAVKPAGSKIEVALTKALYAKGYRYRKNDKSVPGKPDLTFKRLKLAIFVDSEFWHGKDWQTQKNTIKSNHEFWYRKIEGNILRDREVNKELRSLGWKVLRFWGNDIKKRLDYCVAIIEKDILKQNEFFKKTGKQ